MKLFPATMLTLAIALACSGQATPPPTNTPPAATAPAPLAPDVRALLQMLHDRRNTLNNFVGKADYSVYHPVTDDAGGKRGDVAFIIDGSKGAIFSIDFTERTDEKGKVTGHG